MKRNMTSTLFLAMALLLSLWAAPALRAQELPHVYLGRMPCELNQIVSLQAVPGEPGRYVLNFKKFKFTMVAVSTHSGVVRLEDPISGATWVQLNSKSMLMDGRRGVRMVDECQHPSQKAMAEAMKTTPTPPLIEVESSTR